MPVHDWTQVKAGIFHHFHQRWIAEICDALNDGVLPAGYYGLCEQVAGASEADVLTLEMAVEENATAANWLPTAVGSHGLTAVADAPPKVSLSTTLELEQYVRKQSTLVVRHSSGDRIVAFVEVVSPGNKAGRHALQRFVEKVAGALDRGYHVLVLDLQPPTPRDPDGIHGALAEELGDASYRQPPDKPLTLAAYDAGPPTMAFVEPTAVGQPLPVMPLFLKPGGYVSVPLETTYASAFRHVPQRWRRILEG
jgi:hypothetical protein